jgi:hypothetical protein
MKEFGYYPRRVRAVAQFAIHCSILTCSIAVMARVASGKLINLNFSATPYAGTSESSPATPTGPAGVWNNLTTDTLNDPGSYETDVAAVVLSDGSPGPTLTFDATSGSNLNWSGTALGFLATDYTTAGGVYDVVDLYESGLRNNGNNTTGFRIKGLAPGTYDVYLVPMFRSPQAAGEKADAAVSLSVGLGNATDARNSGDFTLTSVAASPTQYIATNLTEWVAATDGSTAYNYVGATVNIDSTDRWLTFLLPDSAASGPDRPGPSTIQLRLTSASEELLGDFNQDGTVDAVDYTVWRNNVGEGSLPNSGMLGGPVGPDHYDLWKAHYGDSNPGSSAASASGLAVPEPRTLLGAQLLLAIACLRRRGRVFG